MMTIDTDKAREMLEVVESYRETARILGCNRETLAKKLPGYGMSTSEAVQISAAIWRSKWDR